MSDELDELLSAFLVEAGEHMSSIDQDLLDLESSPDDQEKIKSIFRAIHTVKGTCGMFGLSRLEKVSHRAEDVLVAIRDGKLRATPQVVTEILEAVDAIKKIFEELDKTGKEPEGDDSEINERLHALLKGEIPNMADVDTSDKDDKNVEGKNPEEISQDSNSTDPRQLSEQSLRVNLGVLDSIMNLVGELVLSRNQLIELAKGDDESKYFSSIQQLNRVTSELQEAVMMTRMQPIGNAWSKLPRVVRDLSVQSGKKVNLEMKGKETEIDRQILQAIADPLTHCVRNSVDHGLESTEERERKGKSPIGNILLNAYSEGGHIIIEVKDDGAGIDVDRVKNKAIERGLITEEKAQDLTDAQIVRYIFEPGFSTAEKVTEISGRGVGMDMVRTNIEKIGGAVDIFSTKGVGTTIQIKIPLTLAIVSALIVNSGGEDSGELFAIPQVSVVELVRISSENRDLLADINGAKVLQLRDQLLPIIDLADILNLSHADRNDAEELSIVVAQVGESQFGLIVDSIHDTQEIVVKPAGRISRDLNLFSGTTILGDGQVILILDIAKISENAYDDVTEINSNHVISETELSQSLSRTSMLLFKSNSKSAMAVPLGLVARLEEFPKKNLEVTSGRHVVQYRESLLPLIAAGGNFDPESIESENVKAIIFTEGGKSLGLVVHDIEDVVETHLEIDKSNSAPGIVGASIIEGVATEILDTQYYLEKAHPNWFEKVRAKESIHGRNILLAEDSQFVSNLLKPLLEAEGYSVSLVGNGKKAIDLLESNSSLFDLIISDIEMPEMDGLELAQFVSSNSELQHIPLIALTALDSDQEREKGLKAGFSEYLVKLDQNELLRCVRKYTSDRKTAQEKAV